MRRCGRRGAERERGDVVADQVAGGFGVALSVEGDGLSLDALLDIGAETLLEMRPHGVGVSGEIGVDGFVQISGGRLAHFDAIDIAPDLIAFGSPSGMETRMEIEDDVAAGAGISLGVLGAIAVVIGIAANETDGLPRGGVGLRPEVGGFAAELADGLAQAIGGEAIADGEGGEEDEGDDDV